MDDHCRISIVMLCVFSLIHLVMTGVLMDKVEKIEKTLEVPVVTLQEQIDGR